VREPVAFPSEGSVPAPPEAAPAAGATIEPPEVENAETASEAERGGSRRTGWWARRLIGSNKG
jgi:hypothetical protein